MTPTDELFHILIWRQRARGVGALLVYLAAANVVTAVVLIGTVTWTTDAAVGVALVGLAIIGACWVLNDYERRLTRAQADLLQEVLYAAV